MGNQYSSVDKLVSMVDDGESTFVAMKFLPSAKPVRACVCVCVCVQAPGTSKQRGVFISLH